MIFFANNLQSYHEGHGHAYENYGIDPEHGAAIILRPDQYISWIGDFDDYDSMDSFFKGFMVDQRGRGHGEEAVANAVKGGASKKDRYSGTQSGTNGLRSSPSAVQAGDDAIQGVGGV